MYAVIRRYEGVERETLLEVARRSHAGFRARLMDRPGFVAYELVVGDDSVAAISVFESWVVAEETNQLARRWVQDNLAEFDLPVPQVTAGEIYSEEGLPPPFATGRSAKVGRALQNEGDVT